MGAARGPEPPLSRSSRRHRFHFHLSTCLAACFAAALLLRINVSETVTPAAQVVFGWPHIYYTQPSVASGVAGGFDYTGVSVNGATALGIVLAVAIPWEFWIRKRRLFNIRMKEGRPVGRRFALHGQTKFVLFVASILLVYYWHSVIGNTCFVPWWVTALALSVVSALFLVIVGLMAEVHARWMHARKKGL